MIDWILSHSCTIGIMLLCGSGFYILKMLKLHGESIDILTLTTDALVSDYAERKGKILKKIIKGKIKHAKQNKDT